MEPFSGERLDEGMQSCDYSESEPEMFILFFSVIFLEMSV